MADESYETTEIYVENYNFMLELIKRRDRLLGLLKIAQPKYRAEIHKTLGEIDNLMQRTENILELERQVFFRKEEAEKEEAELYELSKSIEKELLEHIAANDPEKLELVKAILADDGKSH